MMSKVTYPRPCPHCSKLLNNRFSYCRHKAYCSKSTPQVKCLYCDKSFTRLDNCTNHKKKFHSEAAKRKAEESAKLLSLEIMNSDKVPRLDIKEQVGGAVTTRGKKRVADDGDSKHEAKLPKAEEKEEETPGNDDDGEYEGGRDPLYVADFINWVQQNVGRKMPSESEVHSHVRSATWTKRRRRFTCWCHTCHSSWY